MFMLIENIIATNYLHYWSLHKQNKNILSQPFLHKKLDICSNIMTDRDDLDFFLFNTLLSF